MNKVQPKTHPYVFIRYSSQHKGCHCLRTSIGRVYLSRHLVLNESVFQFASSKKETSRNILTYPSDSIYPTATNITGIHSQPSQFLNAMLYNSDSLNAQNSSPPLILSVRTLFNMLHH